MKQTLGLTPGITKIAGVIGVILLIAGGGVAIWRPESVFLSSLIWVVALLHLAVFFVGHFETMKGFSARRSTRLGADSLLMAGLFITILGILNFIAYRHSTRWDLSSAETFTLSPQTVRILKGLKDDLRLLAFFPERSDGGIAVRDLLESYRFQSRKVTVEMIDPDKKPHLAKQYNVTQYETVVVVAANGRTVTAKAADEQEITAAMIRVSHDAQKTVYFVEGHGEHSIKDEERSGYAMIAASMTQQGLLVKTVTLLAEKRVPDDAAVVIIAGPQRPFTPEERAVLSDFLARGGQLFALVDPAVATDLAPLFAEWGVALSDDQVVDPTSGLGGRVPIITPGSYPDHDITLKFDLATFYPLARSVAPSGAPDFDFEPILKTGTNSWKTAQMTDEITLDPAQDERGPITIGAVTQKKSDVTKDGTEPDPALGAQRARLVVIGDSDFATNNVVHSAGNGDLFQNVVRWLTDETDLIAIRPKEAKTTTLLISSQQAGALFMVSVLLLPIAILTSGWIVRRRRSRL